MPHSTMSKYFNIMAHIKDGQDINGYGWLNEKDVTDPCCQISKEVLDSKALGISQLWLRDCGPEPWRRRIRNPQPPVLEAGRGSSALCHASERKAELRQDPATDLYWHSRAYGSTCIKVHTQSPGDKKQKPTAYNKVLCS